MPLQATSGAASYDGFGGGVAAVPNYIEDVFSTWLYTGNGSTQTITNGIDLTGQGGLVWIKPRNVVDGHYLADTNRGADKYIFTNSSGSQSTVTDRITSFNSSGFSLGSGLTNTNTTTYASWTFREQAKFFDVVTYVGDGTTNRTVAHNLGSTPGCVICKATDASGTTYAWGVWHRGDGTTAYSSFELNSTSAATTDTQFSAFTSTTFKPYVVNNFNAHCNQNGVTYVAYLFAHNAGGFGLTGTDNVISCGSYTGTGAAGNPITLGYEPQYLLIKPSSMSGGWWVLDNMRPGGLRPDSSAAESTSVGSPTLTVQPTATGFSFVDATLNDSGQTFIYIAIRRGPMKTPTTGTSVFSPISISSGGTGNGTGTTNFPVDLCATARLSGGADNTLLVDRLRGAANTSSIRWLTTSNTNAEATGSGYGISLASNTSFTSASLWSTPAIYWNFQRAPGFFDVVCYTGTGVNRTVSHNLGVVPELMLVKARSTTQGWLVYSAAIGNTDFLRLNSDVASAASTLAWNNTTPTSTVFTVGTATNVNGSGDTYVAYLFASCPGVSKVTNFTGTGSLQTINCGFTGGARLVLIKRTDASGDWYIWDSSRGISSSTDPYLLLNSTAAEVTTTNWVDTTSTGFQVTAASGNNVNINGASYIALAIA